MQSHPSPTPALTLNFYAPDRALAHSLAEQLHAHAYVQWLDSVQLPPGKLAQAGLLGPVLLLDFSAPHADASTALAQQLNELSPECSLVAVGSSSGANAAGVLAALRAGVRDFVDVNASADDSALLLHKIHASAKSLRQALVPVPKRRARLTLLRGVRPGVGTSTLTAHLGALIQQRLQSAASTPAGSSDDAPRVLLLDLGRPAADLSLYLNVEPGYRYEEMLANTARLDATLIRSALATDHRGVAVVGQLPNTVDAPTGGAEIGTLLSTLRGLFDVILCDLGGLPDQHIPLPLLHEADGIWLVTDQSIASLVSLDHTLLELATRRARDARVSLVLNRHHPEAGISASQIASRFDLPLAACIPERLHALRSASGVGRLLVDEAPKDPYLRALAPLADRLVAVPGMRDLTHKPWHTFMQRLGAQRWKKR